MHRIGKSFKKLAIALTLSRKNSYLFLLFLQKGQRNSTLFMHAKQNIRSQFKCAQGSSNGFEQIEHFKSGFIASSLMYRKRDIN